MLCLVALQEIDRAQCPTKIPVGDLGALVTSSISLVRKNHDTVITWEGVGGPKVACSSGKMLFSSWCWLRSFFWLLWLADGTTQTNPGSMSNKSNLKHSSRRRIRPCHASIEWLFLDTAMLAAWHQNSEIQTPSTNQHLLTVRYISWFSICNYLSILWFSICKCKII